MPPDFEVFYLRHCRAIYRVCFAFLKNASPVQGELFAVRLTEGLTGTNYAQLHLAYRRRGVFCKGVTYTPIRRGPVCSRLRRRRVTGE